MDVFEWQRQARLGLFLHWGLYSCAARHEWVRKLEETSDEDYDRYLELFNPDLYDPTAWARTARQAGMKYFVITTKHHEGFCLWDSRYTDYKATNTPAGRDLLGPMVEAFRAEGLRVGLYYSLIDWHHPHFPIDSVHPLSNHPDRAKLNAQRDPQKYIEYLHNQVRELLTDFGKIDLLFFDFTYPKPFAWPPGMEADWQGTTAESWDAKNLVKMIRQLQPDCLINDRLGLRDDRSAWDFITPEQFEPPTWPSRNGEKVPWETCQTFSGSWGYFRDEYTWKSTDQLVRMLVNTVSKGGNLLLNVGPTARGQFDPRATERLAEMGEWMALHGASIDRCTAAPDNLTPPRDCRYTWNPDTRRLYCHVFAWPFRVFILPGLAEQVHYARLLHDGSELKMGLDPWLAAQQEKLVGPSARQDLYLELPVAQPDTPVPVIELFVK